MILRWFGSLLVVFTLTFTTSNPANAITLGQVDDFENLTTQSWIISIDIENPSNVPDGGPNGAGDAFLQYSSTGGSGPGSRLIFYNTDQWTGDYVAAGVTGIAADVKHVAGTEPIELRVAFGPSSNAASGSWFASTAPIVLQPGSDWQSVVFPLDEASLTQVRGLDAYGSVISSVGGLRILSSSAPDNKGDAFIATLGIDNIEAIGVPEPAAALLAVIAGAAMLGRR